MLCANDVDLIGDTRSYMKENINGWMNSLETSRLSLLGLAELCQVVEVSILLIEKTKMWMGQELSGVEIFGCHMIRVLSDHEVLSKAKGKFYTRQLRPCRFIVQHGAIK